MRTIRSGLITELADVFSVAMDEASDTYTTEQLVKLRNEIIDLIQIGGSSSVDTIDVGSYVRVLVGHWIGKEGYVKRRVPGAHAFEVELEDGSRCYSASEVKVVPPIPVLTQTMKITPHVMQLSTVLLLPGSDGDMFSRSMLDVFRPEWLVIPKHIGRHLDVLDIRVGNQLLLIGTDGVIDGLCFRETLTEKVRMKLDWRSIKPSEQIRIRVKNTSALTITAKAHVLGIHGK